MAALSKERWTAPRLSITNAENRTLAILYRARASLSTQTAMRKELWELAERVPWSS